MAGADLEAAHRHRGHRAHAIHPDLGAQRGDQIIKHARGFGVLEYRADRRRAGEVDRVEFRVDDHADQVVQLPGVGRRFPHRPGDVQRDRVRSVLVQDRA
jgi:hypothetical protein